MEMFLPDVGDGADMAVARPCGGIEGPFWGLQLGISLEFGVWVLVFCPRPNLES